MIFFWMLLGNWVFFLIYKCNLLSAKFELYITIHTVDSYLNFNVRHRVMTHMGSLESTKEEQKESKSVIIAAWSKGTWQPL